MSLEIPTTLQITDEIVAHIEASISQTIPLLPKAFTRVAAKAFAGATVVLYKYVGFAFLQQFVSTATDRETTVNGKVIRPLVEWGRLVGADDPEPATKAELVISVTVLTQTGDLAAGTQLVRTETGVVYVTKTIVALDAATVQVTIVASSDQDGGDGSGSIGNLEAGDIVSFANPPATIAREATVVSQAVTGADAETIDEYRAEVLARFQARPQGGAYADYRSWGLSVAGIVAIYPYTADLPGEIDIFVEADEPSSGSADGIPTGAQLTAVFDAINLDVDGRATRRPANDAINVYAITRTAFDVRISGLSVNVGDETAVETAIEDGIDEYLRSREPFIVGLSVLPRVDRITRASIGGIVDGIVSAYGGTVTSIELLLDTAVISAYTLDHGEKAKAGTFTYV